MEAEAFRELLRDDVAVLTTAHLARARDWYPHEFATDEVQPEAPTDDDDELARRVALRSALFVNLLTEDNLPYYTSEIERWFGRDEAWSVWSRRWTAEEGRHSIGLREWTHRSRVLDPFLVEQGRMATVQRGVDDHGITAPQALIYVALQELATRIAHHNTARLVRDRLGRQLMQRIAVDENLHFLFYRDLASRLFSHAPDDAVTALDHVVRHFAMPGVGIPDFRDHALVMARAGVYDWTTHVHSVVRPLLRVWRVEELEGLSGEADRARHKVLRHVTRLERVAQRLDDASSAAPSGRGGAVAAQR